MTITELSQTTNSDDVQAWSDDDLRTADAPAQLHVGEYGGAVEEERLGHVDALAQHRLGDEAPLADGRGQADNLYMKVAGG